MPPVDKDRNVKAAQKFLTTGKVDKAIPLLQEVVDQSPNEWNIINQLGDLYAQVGNQKQAINMYLQIGGHFAEEGFTLKAIAILKKVTRLNPSFWEAYVRLADLYAQQGMIAEAKSNLVTVADQYIKEGKLESALKTYERIVALEPENLKNRIRCAELYQKQGKTSEALGEFQVISNALVKQGMLEESIQVYEKALALDPTNVDIIRGLAKSMSELGDHAKAISFVERHLQSQPRSIDLQNLLGEVQIRAGKTGEAEKTFGKLLQMNPDAVEGLVNMSKLLLKRGDAKGAAAHFKKVQERLVAQSRTEEVIGFCTEILRHDEGCIPALETMVALHARTGSDEKMLGERLARLADAYLAAGNAVKAVAALTKLVEIEPEVKQHHEKLDFARKNLAAPGAAAPPADAARKPAAAPPKPAPAPSPAKPAAPSEVKAPAVPPAGKTAPPKPPPAAAPSEVPVEEEGVVIETGQEDEEIAAVPRKSTGSAEKEIIAETLTQVEVCIKYGLIDKAIEQLLGLVKAYPTSLEAHQKLRDLFVEEGLKDKAVEECITMAEICRSRGDADAAEDILSEALTIDPNNERLKMILEPAAPAARPAEAAKGAARPPAGKPVGPPAAPASATKPSPAPPPAVKAPPAPVATVPGKAAAGAPSDEDFEEVDFYIQQDFTSEAVELLKELHAKYGPHEDIVVRLEICGVDPATMEEAAAPVVGPAEQVATPAKAAARPSAVQPEAAKPAPQAAKTTPLSVPVAPAKPAQAVPAAASSPPTAAEEDLFAEEKEFFDLNSELSEELGEDISIIDDGISQRSISELVGDIKKKIDEQVAAEDYETHYNLGIAYKEMGLLEEAIAEFQHAAKDSNRFLASCSLLGRCFIEKGMPQLAVQWYTKGLGATGREPEEMTGLRTELAALYESIGEADKAEEIRREIGK